VDPNKAPGVLSKAAGIAWTHDCLRHAYGTFRNAILKNVSAVSEEMGNSIAVCKAHYLNPHVTPAQGEEWFAIKPDETGKITLLAG